MFNLQLEQFVSIFTNPELNITGTILNKQTNESTIIEFQAHDLSCEKSLMLYSKLGSSLENILKDFFGNKENKTDKMTQKIHELKTKNFNTDEIVAEISNSENIGVDVSIAFKIVAEIMRNEELTRFLTQDVIKNYILVKTGNNAYTKIDGTVHSFDKPEYRKFLFKLWIQIIIKEMIVFMGGQQS